MITFVIKVIDNRNNSTSIYKVISNSYDNAMALLLNTHKELNTSTENNEELTKVQLLVIDATLTSVIELTNETTLVDLDNLKMFFTEMESIPAGANPFRHDSWSMGTELTGSWIAMHQGYGDKELTSIYLVNTKSGERFNITTPARVKELRDTLEVIGE